MAAIPLASLAAGPLADRLAEPAMAAGGALAPVFGPALGLGRGRGIALAIAASGAVSVLIAVAAAAYGPVRRLDEEGLAPASGAPERDQAPAQAAAAHRATAGRSDVPASGAPDRDRTLTDTANAAADDRAALGNTNDESASLGLPESGPAPARAES
jgi:hypothetical protein